MKPTTYANKPKPLAESASLAPAIPAIDLDAVNPWDTKIDNYMKFLRELNLRVDTMRWFRQMVGHVGGPTVMVWPEGQWARFQENFLEKIHDVETFRSLVAFCLSCKAQWSAARLQRFLLLVLGFHTMWEQAREFVVLQTATEDPSGRSDLSDVREPKKVSI